MAENRYTYREAMLQNATGYVTKERNKSYGEPDEDFQRIAAIANAMGFRIVATPDNPVARDLTGSDVARFMIALKLARLSWSPAHEDSWTDIAGYAACGFETATLEQERADRSEFQTSIRKETGHGFDGCPACIAATVAPE